MCRGLGVSGSGSIEDCNLSLDNFTDETRLEKIDSLRKALAEKIYHVSAADLARKIIDHMLRS